MTTQQFTRAAQIDTKLDQLEMHLHVMQGIKGNVVDLNIEPKVQVHSKDYRAEMYYRLLPDNLLNEYIASVKKEITDLKTEFANL